MRMWLMRTESTEERRREEGGGIREGGEGAKRGERRNGGRLEKIKKEE